MPTYTFRNTETDEVKDYTMKMSDLDQFKKDNPNLISVPQILEPVTGINMKPDKGFRELLKGLKKSNIRSNINTFE